MELFRLFGSILIDDKEAIDKLKSTDTKAKGTADKLGQVADKGLAIGAAVVAGTAAAVGGMIALANETAGTADKWDKLSLRTGIGVENLQRWGYAAQQSGGDIMTLERGIKTLSDSMINATNGGKAAQSAYEQLGISMDELSKMTPEQAFERTMFALSKMEDGALKNSIGNDILGKSYLELKPLLAQGADGMQALKDRADELGIVMSEDAVAAGVLYGDTMDDVKSSFQAVTDRIATGLMPKLTELLNWIIANMPQIEATANKVLNGMSDAIGWIVDNSNILIPILGGLAGSFIALKVIAIVNGLMAAYTAFTTTATGVQIGLNAAMLANPIGLIIAGIAALIAIGIALYMNWDTIKEKALQLWENVKSVFTTVLDFVKNNWQGLLLLILNPFAGAFKLVYDNNEKFRNMIDGFVSRVKEIVSNVFGTLKDIITKPFTTARDVIAGVVEKIKGFFNFNVSLPKIKLPHFKIKPSGWELGDLLKGKIPSLGIDWYAKGGIFDRPTIFPTASGFKGVGEAGPEAVTPISALMDYVRQAVREGNGNEQLIRLMESFMDRMMGLQVVMDTGEVVGVLASPMDNELRRIMSRRER